MRVRELTSDGERATFRERFMAISQERSAGAISGAVPLAYLQRSKVMGVFVEGQLVAGYVLGTHPLRILDRFMPEDAVVAWPANFDRENACELVCAWREPSFSTARMTGLIAPLGFLQSLGTGAPYVLGVCQHIRIHQHYERLGGTCVWHGTSRDGLETWVYAVRRRSRLAIVASLVFMAGPQAWLSQRKSR